MTGEVFKHTEEGWVPSSAVDTTDCICSVKPTGTWKEFIGICTNIDHSQSESLANASQKNNCITFASGGDYLIKVDDSSCYSIGDEVFVDTEDNKLKILSGATAITSKIRRTTIGIITGIIDKKTIAVFK